MNSERELSQQNLTWMLEWVGRFDNKASIILGLDLGMLSLLVTRAPTFDKWTSWMWGSCALSLIALGLSFVSIYFSNFPRTGGPENSLYYFGTIADIEINQFCNQFSSKSEEEHIEDLLRQTHRNAEILNIKFEYLKSAYILLVFGIVPWAISLFLFNNV